MFKLGDIVIIKKEDPTNYGYIAEIKPKTKYPWNVKVVFFDDEEWGNYPDHELVKVSNEQVEKAIQKVKKEIS
jgi:hypothetical protein